MGGGASKHGYPEARVKKPYTTFDAVNFLIEAYCVALVRATFLLNYEGPIDVRQTLDAVAGAMFHGPLELGDAMLFGALIMPEHVVIALSYTWAPKGPFFGEPGNEDGTKDHPDPEKHYLGIGRRVLGLMLVIVLVLLVPTLPWPASAPPMLLLVLPKLLPVLLMLLLVLVLVLVLSLSLISASAFRELRCACDRASASDGDRSSGPMR